VSAKEPPGTGTRGKTRTLIFIYSVFKWTWKSAAIVKRYVGAYNIALLNWPCIPFVKRNERRNKRRTKDYKSKVGIRDI
jgi:hypothetical protein